jgi:hypothetical protein
VTARSPRQDYVWPRRTPSAGEAIGDYLFVRRGLFQGDGLIQTSTILAPRSLLMEIPFSSSLPVHQDWDWVLNATTAPEVSLHFVERPLAIWYIEEDRFTISRSSTWRASLAWILSHHRLRVSDRALASFVLTVVAARAARDSDWRAIPAILASAFRHGRPRAIDLLIFAGIWTFPEWLRRQLRARYSAMSRFLRGLLKRAGHEV